MMIFFSPFYVYIFVFILWDMRGGKPLKCKQWSKCHCTRHWAHSSAGMVYNDQS